ncbi:MAG: MBL fold metallo-hydrolase [Deltaproteobacteria bacterium]|nr:MBL fold metallo-hydrolase [Deltaproteobacteria bacterium]
MYPKRLSDRITVLGNHYLQTYLVEGDGMTMLIEPGISATATQVVRQMRSAHIDPLTIDRLFLTHAHGDHITGGPILKRAMPQLVVTASPETTRLLKKKKVRQIFIRDDHDTGVRLKQLGATTESPAPDLNESLNGLVEVHVAPGQIMDLGGLSVVVMDAPGHCIGGVALWVPEEKVLFCSDYLGFFLPPDQFVPNFYVDLEDYMATFDTLAQLDADWICPGHCGVYTGEARRRFIEQSRAEIEWVRHRVTEGRTGPDAGEGLQEALFERYYVREATMFSEHSTRYCMDLIIRRIMDITRTEADA